MIVAVTFTKKKKTENKYVKKTENEYVKKIENKYENKTESIFITELIVSCKK